MRYLLLTCVLLAGCEVRFDDGHHHRTTQCPDGKCPYTKTIQKTIVIHDWRTADNTIPAMHLPPELRQHNWGSGSCVHASTVMCLRWQNQLQWADYWRATYSGGESLQGLVNKLESHNLNYAYTADGDEQFLEWASRTHRGAVIFYFPSHSICYCGHHHSPDGQDVAYLLDNNREDHYLTVPWSEFVTNWRRYGGVALTPIYYPPPPAPYL